MTIIYVELGGVTAAILLRQTGSKQTFNEI